MPVGDTKIAMAAYFERSAADWKHRFGAFHGRRDPTRGITRCSWGGRTEDWIQWQPVPKDSDEVLAALEREIGMPLHPSVRELWGSYWFGHIGRTFKNGFAELEGVLPGAEPFGLHDQVLGYRRAHGGKLDKIPIGLESTRDLLLVVDNTTGAVEVEDYEVQRFEPLANSLAEAHQRAAPYGAPARLIHLSLLAH